MSAKQIVLAATALLVASSAHATVIEIPLPGLLGSYQNTSHTVSVVLPASPAVIHGASFRVSGTKVAGQMYCDEPFPPSVQPLPIALSAELPADDFSSAWFAEDPAVMTASGAFTWTSAFYPVPFSATWSFLMDGIANLTFLGADPGTWCQVLSSPSAVITEAVFIIDADFPIPIEASTWGKIKALYR